jgi:hypothetical protein
MVILFDLLQGFLLKMLLNSRYLIAAVISKDFFLATEHFRALAFFDESPDCTYVGGTVKSPFNSL